MILSCQTVTYDSLDGFPMTVVKGGSETITYEDADFRERSEDVDLELAFRIYCLTWHLPKRCPGATMPLFLAQCWEYSEKEAHKMKESHGNH